MASNVLSALLLLITGWVDVLGYLHFQHTFISFMSGNSTKFGVAVGQGDATELARIGVVIAAFFVATVGGELLHIAARPWQRPAVLAAVLVLLLGAAWGSADGVGQYGETVLLALAMGTQNAVLHRGFMIASGLTYITGTIVQMGRTLAGALLGKGGWGKIATYGSEWAALILGAIGATVLVASATVGIEVAAGLVAAGLLLSLWMGPEHNPEA